MSRIEPGIKLLFVVVLLSACSQRPESVTDRVQSETGIQAHAIQGHLEFLAGDLTEGREAGTRGYDLAAQYVASQYRALGLEPAGENDGYFQQVPLSLAALEPESVRFEISGPSGKREFVNGESVAVFASQEDTSQIIDAPLFFAGWGRFAPELGIDDYAGLDVTGAVVAVLGGPSPGPDPEIAAHLGSSGEKRRAAAARGAAGVLVIYTPALEARFPFSRMSGYVETPSMQWLNPDASPHQPAPGLKFSGLVDGEATAALFEGSGRDLQDVLATPPEADGGGFSLPARVRIERKSTHESLASPNVVGLLRGSDPLLSEEIVVLTAHLDHMGMGTDDEGEAVIYNGALDNAVGVAAMLEVARALSAAELPPRRSVLFLAVTAEEKGLIGSDYFVHHPTVAIEHIVANINLDGMVPFYEFIDVTAFGGERSTLGDAVAEAANEMGLVVSPDPFPEQAIFTRSDHYSFVKKGIPAIFLFTGFETGPDGKSGRESWEWALANHYHQPSDNLDLPIDYGIAARFTELYLEVARRVANSRETPKWHPGDYFGVRYGRAPILTTRNAGTGHPCCTSSSVDRAEDIGS